MKRILWTLIIVAVIAVSLYAVSLPPKKNLAQGVIKPELILNQIKVGGEQEHDGDELFLTLNSRVSGGVIEYQRIPAKPGHWLSRQIDEVKNVSLWSAPLADGQSATVNIELNDEDAEPLDPDDLLGLMRVELKNEKGSLVVHWDIPQRTGIDAPKKREGEVADTFSEESGHVVKFLLNNDGSYYEVHLSVKHKSH